MMKHHFISYSSFDAKDFAFKLHEALEKSSPSISVWMDKHDMKPSKDWDDQLVQAIRECESLIFVMTPDSTESQSVCKQEWSRALKYKKPIVPLKLHHDVEMPFRLGSRQYINFTGDFSEALQQLHTHLHWLGSPEGRLQVLQDRLSDAHRDLRRASPTTETHIQQEIDELQEDIAHQQAIIQHPEALVQEATVRIKEGLTLDRKPLSPFTGLGEIQCINTAPIVPPKYFQNRDEETRLIWEFLHDPGKSLLTVVGREGIGKTSLICRILKEVEQGKWPKDIEPFSTKGIIYISTAGTRRMTWINLFEDLCRLVSDENAQCLESLFLQSDTRTYEKMEALIEAFQSDITLVLLDNVENVIDPETRNFLDPDLDTALRCLLDQGSPHLKILLTTRVAPKDLPLVQPARQMSIRLQEGLESPFAENILRHMDADGSLGLQSASDRLLKIAKERTQGNPRALEALYAILSADRDTTLEEMLNDTTNLLPEHVLKVLIGEAFFRLDRLAQQVLYALAIYDRPVTSSAVDYLLQPYVSSIDSSSILKRLYNLHLVQKEAKRYQLHPIDRSYALSQIAPDEHSGPPEGPPPFTQRSLRHRAADYFKEIRLPQESWNSLDDLAPQLAEFELRLAAGYYETALTLLVTFDFDYLLRWGYYQLMADLHRQLLGHLESPTAQQQNLGNLGTAYYRMGDLDQALQFYQNALALAREQQDTAAESTVLGNLGLCYRGKGEVNEAIRHYEQALSIFRQRGQRDSEATILMNLGATFNSFGQSTLALEVLDQARQIYVETNNSNNQAMTLICMGESYGNLGNLPRASDYSQQGLALAKNVANPFMQGAALCILGDLETDQSHWEQAMVHFHDALTLAEQIGNAEIQRIARTKLAQTLLLSDQLSGAMRTLTQLSQRNHSSEEYLFPTLFGITALRLGNEQTAREKFEQALALLQTRVDHYPQDIGALFGKALIHCGLAMCQTKPDGLRLAIETYQKAHALTKDNGIINRTRRLFDALALADSHQILSPDIREAAYGQKTRVSNQS